MDSDNFKIVSVKKDTVTIEILDVSQFEGQFNIGSYIKIPYEKDSDNYIVGVIKNYQIKNIDSPAADVSPSLPNFTIEVELVGSYKKQNEKYIFTRGAHGIPLPPCNGIEILTEDDYKNIYFCKINESEKFIFSKLVQDLSLDIPVNGNKFFNKHFAIVGSTGTGKSHTVASLLQQALKEKNEGYEGLNNSHIVIFDIHGEYKKAFPEANHLNSSNIKIPYWLFDSDELSDLFIESNEFNSHNQVSQFRYAVTENKKKEELLEGIQGTPSDKIYFDTPVKFKIDEVINYIKNLNNELINKKNNRNPTTKESEEINNRVPRYFEEELIFEKLNSDFSNGPYTGDFERFILRLMTTRNNPRLRFLFDNVYELKLEDVIKQFIGYGEKNTNITIIDLSGIPFEVLSITVSLISRILFEFGYFYKRLLAEENDCETPLLMVYEEAHKYAPKSGLARFNASKNAIERIAKEGRKYGVTLGIVSQRPSEISETIFSQCNNFIVMRLTNPEDQNYVKRLLPDNLSDLTDYLPTLEAGEALVIGESIIIPSLVKINYPDKEPKSSDIKYLELWKQKWKDVNFENITREWKK